jgi:hypothetical protein
VFRLKKSKEKPKNHGKRKTKKRKKNCMRSSRTFKKRDTGTPKSAEWYASAP